MNSESQISRLSFTGTPAERFALFYSRKARLWVAVLLASALIVTAILYVWTREPFVFLIMFAPLLGSAGTAVLWPATVRFSASGDVAAMFAYLDKLMSDAAGYQRSVGATGEIVYRYAGKGWLAESRSYCVLAVRDGALEVSGSRDILRRLRYWAAQHFAGANAPTPA